MTLHDARGGVNQIYQMFLELCCSVTLHDERGGFKSNAVGAMLFCDAA